ncbi:uncharacterized protein RHO25_012812 [Cercospora beticola]|uniref:RING-type domain-containing protein n=1 Tax=Cercospora beticola TaxID=122368 RepID=A0ABZ0P8K9_CERBT|nr:hypothetical protein RHO25_012812 [Cercospora beticola]
MQTQDEFLSNPGLVPQQHTVNRDCMICHEELINPVTTSSCECRVQYCRECIMAWFKSSNKCATCSTRLYYLKPDHDEEEYIYNEHEDENQGYRESYLFEVEAKFTCNALQLMILFSVLLFLFVISWQ